MPQPVQEFHKDIRAHLRMLARAANAGLTETEADALYLRLDTTNDPLTAGLEIEGNLTLNQDGTAGNASLVGRVDAANAFDIQLFNVGVLESLLRIRDTGEFQFQRRNPTGITHFSINQTRVAQLPDGGGPLLLGTPTASHYHSLTSTTNNDAVEFGLAVNEGVNNRRFRMLLDDAGGEARLQTSASTGVPDMTFFTGGTERARIAGDGSLTTINTPVHITDVTDVGLNTNPAAFNVGTLTASNVAIDGNEIMARNNGAAAELFLNNEGGVVSVNSNFGGIDLFNSGVDGVVRAPTGDLQLRVASHANHLTLSDGVTGAVLAKIDEDELATNEDLLRFGPQSTTQFISGMSISDHRANNFLPTNYNYVHAVEFKQRTALDDSVVLGTQTYGALESIAPWGDSSGGSVHQNFYTNRHVWRRSQPLGSAGWNTDGRGRWTQYRLGHQYDNGSAEFNEYFPDEQSHLSIDSSAQTGAFKIEMPVGPSSNMMVWFEVHGYDYSTAVDSGGAWGIVVSGYTFSDWRNSHVHAMYGCPPFRRVRFYMDGSRAGVLLGETTDVHQYPKVVVKNVFATFGDPSNHDWSSGWSTSLITSTAGLTIEDDHYLQRTYSQDGRFIPGGPIYPQTFSDITPQSAGYLSAVGGNYGSVMAEGAAGTSGTWRGFSIGNRLVFMDNAGSATSNRGGIYDDLNNQWVLQYNAGGAGEDDLTFYNLGTAEAETRNSDATGNSSGLRVKKHDQELVDVGFNVMRRERTNVSFTVRAEEAGGFAYYNNTTAYTITLDSNTDFPVDSRFEVIQLSTGNITISASGVTLYWFDGSGAATSGNRTVGAGGWATIHRYSSTVWFITGAGIS